MTPNFFIPNNFLGLPDTLSNENNARVFILPVPYDGTTTYAAGTRNGPAAILEASKNIELYDPVLKKEPCSIGIHTLPMLETCSLVDRMVNRVAEATKYILSKQKFPCIIGGEHSISYGVFKAFRDIYPTVTVLQLDAHADQRDTYGGTPYSHACVMRRISSETKYAGVGIRSMSIEEAEWIEKQNYICLAPSALHERKSLAAVIKSVLQEPVYITIDLDFLDPSIMPSVGTPEPGGLLWDDTLWLLHWICTNFNVVGCDVVELCPIPGLVAPDFLAAKLVYHLIGLIFQ